jgi:predicted dehydrogenase
MARVKLGIIGVGGMGSNHARNIKNIRNCDLVAVCDTVKEKADSLSKELNCKAWYDPDGLINSGTVDAVIIATPHYAHTTIGIAALKKGLHVLVEKPISVHKADCERLIAAHTNKKQMFQAMFQMRTLPLFIKIKKLLDEGALGEIRRVNWIITNWFRTEAYYASGGWRATWKGEGGGVLLNQCPHNLDIITWLLGMPASVQGFCRLGKWHAIEVEDDVTAYLTYPNGATGVFVTTTGEAPGTDRLEIVGENGKLVAEGWKLRFTRNETPMGQFCRTSKESFAAPDTWDIEIPIRGDGGHHALVIQNFVDAIVDGKPLLAPAAEGMRAVELANCMLYSSLTGKPVQLPLDAPAYEAMLKKLVKESKFEKKVMDDVKVDMAASFHNK